MFHLFHPEGPTFFELARQALSSTERGYDLLAPKFDFTPFRTPDFVFAAFNLWLTRFGPFDNALDVCCGTGAAMQSIAPLTRQRLVGLDMSAGMLKQGAENLSSMMDARSDLQVDFVKGSAFEMPFESEFDLAISFGAFGHILPKDEERFVREIFKTLKPGGKFAFLTSRMPSMLAPVYWMARGFNAAIHVRNLLIKPPFIMYYLTFLWPDIGEKLNDVGFEVVAESASNLFVGNNGVAVSAGNETDLIQFVIATKPE